jgi:probable HAF family extracellular repeat protein
MFTLVLAGSLVLAAGDTLAQRYYTAAQLPTSATAINNIGQAAVTAAIKPPYFSAFLWSRGTLTNLGSLGNAGSRAYGINDLGQVVGDSDTGPLSESSPAHTFRYSTGKMADLGTLGGRYSTAIAINQRGDVAGTSATASGQEHAFRYAGGRMTDLGTLDGRRSTAMDINAAGQVVGESRGHAFLYDGVMRDLGAPLGYSLARAINDAGQVVGVSGTSVFDVDYNGHAFLYSDGKMQDLGTLGERFSSAFDINNHGEIVGWTDVTGHDGRLAFFYADGQMRTLDSMVLGAPTISFGMAFAINDAGQILASGLDTRAQAWGSYLLTPVPEPDTWLMLGCGAVVLLCRQRSMWGRMERTYKVQG